jgi:8-oxo-dGTP pyrophosphatase MutT (NUDIX family)
MPSKIDVTVAAVVESERRFLLVEECVNGSTVFNQPAGHLEPGETLLEAVVRETLEETGYGFRPRCLIGVYLWQHPETARSFLRVAFTGSAVAPRSTPRLDEGIVAVHWKSRDELLRHELCARSPMVLQCIDDYLAGTRYPLEALVHVLPTMDELAKRA